jgi:hypothetical protein
LHRSNGVLVFFTGKIKHKNNILITFLIKKTFMVPPPPPQPLKYAEAIRDNKHPDIWTYLQILKNLTRQKCLHCKRGHVRRKQDIW